MGASAEAPRRVVLATYPFGEDVMAVMGENVDFRRVAAAGVAPSEVDLADADALLVVPADAIGESLMARAPRLRIVAVAGAGIDGIDIEAAKRRTIEIRTAAAETSEAVADLAFGLLLAVARRIADLDARMHRGEHVAFMQDPGALEVFGRTLGLVGLGNSGQAMARRARGFGMRVLYAAPRRKLREERELDAQHVELARLLAESDFVSIHAPMNETTRGLFDFERLRQMKPTAVLVNTARGAVVVEDDLVRALRAGVLAGAGLDVFEHEPTVHPDLLRLGNVVCTPHVGTALRSVRSRMAVRAAREILSFFGAS